jgi:transposase-like protein
MKGKNSLRKKKPYSSEFKLQVVKDYLDSSKSLNNIANEYSVPSVNTVHIELDMKNNPNSHFTIKSFHASVKK